MSNLSKFYDVVEVVHGFIDEKISSKLSEKHFIHVFVKRETIDVTVNPNVMNELYLELNNLVIKKTLEVLGIEDVERYLLEHEGAKIARLYTEQESTSSIKRNGINYFHTSLDLVVEPLIGIPKEVSE